VPENIPAVPVTAAGAPAGRFVPVVDDHECIGCNLCALVCPVSGCITMTQVPGPTGKSHTWNDRVAAGTDVNPGSMFSTLKKRGLSP
jgi:dihydropyrimidine dehydrogenase (NAD+) subunit PreA